MLTLINIIGVEFSIGEIITVCSVLVAFGVFIFNSGKIRKGDETAIDSANKSIENNKDNIELAHSRIKELAKRQEDIRSSLKVDINNALNKSDEIKNQILSKLAEIEKTVIKDTTWLKENVKALTILIQKHDQEIDKIKEKIK